MSVGKLKQPTSSKSDVQKIERVKLKVPAVDRIYPSFLFKKNLVKAQVADPAESKFFIDYVVLFVKNWLPYRFHFPFCFAQ